MDDKNLSLDKNGELYGEWWIPNSKNIVLGILKYSPNILKLELHKPLKNKQQSIYKIPIIYGIVNKIQITLQCARWISSSSKFGSPSQIFIISYACIGSHIPNVTDFKIKKINLSFSLSKYWFDITGFNNKLFESKKIKYSMKYKEIPKRTYKINNFTTITFFIEYSITRQIHEPDSLDENPIIIIEWKNGINIDELFRFIENLKSFFTFGIGHIVKPLEIRWEMTNCNPSLDYGYILTTKFNVGKNHVNINDDYILYSFATIKSYFKKYLKNWGEKEYLIGIMRKHYLLVISEDSHNYQNDFLFMIRGIESYARRLKSKKLTLKNILENMIDKFPFLFDRINHEKFIKNVISERDYLTHYIPNKKFQDLNNELLLSINQKLLLLIESCLLYEIGFTFNNIKKIMDNRQSR